MLEQYKMLQEAAKVFGVTIPLVAPFTPADVNKLYPLLRLPLDEEAVQRAKASETGKGYDSAGYSYQAHIDRMNFVLGPSHWTWDILNEMFEEGLTSYDRAKFVYSAEIELLIGYRHLNEEAKQWEWLTVHSVPPIPTDHESTEKGSARKGMLTKGIKRSTSFLGVGADAYLGILDDDLITGVQPDEKMAPMQQQQPRKAKRQRFEDKLVDERDWSQLLGLARLKGFNDLQLRAFYQAETEGRITNDPASLTKAEAGEVKGYLLKLPDFVEKEPEVTQAPDPDEIADNKRPTTFAELVALPEIEIRKLAAEYSVQLPADITDKTKSPLCKTIALLMGIK